MGILFPSADDLTLAVDSVLSILQHLETLKA